MKDLLLKIILYKLKSPIEIKKSICMCMCMCMCMKIWVNSSKPNNIKLKKK